MAPVPDLPAGEADRRIALALSGDRSALAKVLSAIERGGELSERIDRAVAGQTGRACTIGITGAPGAGKSTLLGALLSELAGAGERGAALMVDPSSPVTSGALLGDRVRIQGIAAHDGVFARSMASRGRLGGLADMTRRACRFLDAAGWPWIFVETVGTGQVEVEISTLADVVLVVVHPGAGDEVQAFKAGLMEVADIFVLNKADHPLAPRLRQDLASMIATIPAGRHVPAVVETVASTGAGIAALWQEIRRTVAAARDSGALAQRRSARIDRELVEVMTSITAGRIEALCAGSRFRELRDEVAAGRQSVDAVARLLLQRL